MFGVIGIWVKLLGFVENYLNGILIVGVDDRWQYN